ncbi:uncharacterized protein LOC125448552 isoform X2 [Stegostoma tigrinum]|uniref:uncharacterized protein LOC125448552 isoform X2 n=1 Tax=Stegostoma tigrinum TaxID=3053191 RepID=UPI00202B341E|nr:uncharacterized protein LOC125448552 isoform X2 [Stegostoma tigrinum]
MVQPLKAIDWTVTEFNENPKETDWHVATMNRSLSAAFYHLSTRYDELPLKFRIKYVLRVIQAIYYPILAIVGLTVNSVTIIILSQGKCGLSRWITHYLVAIFQIIVCALNFVLDSYFLPCLSFFVCRLLFHLMPEIP